MTKLKTCTWITALMVIICSALFCATAYAEEPDPYTDRTGVFVTDNTTVTFKKEIVLKNEGGGYVYSPDITYTYTIAPVSEAELKNATVTDSDGESSTVKPGKVGGVTMNGDGNTAAFTSERIELTSGLATISKNLTATIHLDEFENTAGGGQAGIYRYVITETVDRSELTEQGLSRIKSYKEKRYLDIYLVNATETNSDGTQNTVFKVGGYVIFAADDASGVINNKYSTADTIVGKTDGFTDTTEQSGGGEGVSSLADTYYTYNLTVNVDILGSLADTTHSFPVTIDAVSKDDSSGVSGRLFDYYVTQNGAVTEYTSAAGDGIVHPGGTIGTPVTSNLAKGDSITLVGLPANISFNVTETNNTGETYHISVKSGDITLKDKSAVSVAQNGTISAFDATDSQSAYRALTSYTDYTTGKLSQNHSNLTFTNTLNDVSLTGVVLRYGPYLILLGAAVVLGIVFVRSRKKKAPKNII